MLKDEACLVSFGKFVREGRDRQGLYQSQVAEQLNITQQNYSKIELGKMNVDFVTALRICEILHLDISDYIKAYL